jgi:hypothetical protein
MHTTVSTTYTLDTTNPEQPKLVATTLIDHDTTTAFTHTVVHELQVTNYAVVTLRELHPDCPQQPHEIPMAPLTAYLLGKRVNPYLLLGGFVREFKRAVESIIDLAVADFITEALADGHKTHRAAQRAQSEANRKRGTADDPLYRIISS